MANRVFLREKKKENAGVAHTDLAKWPERLRKTSKREGNPLKPLKRGATFRPSFSSKVIILLPFRKNTLAHSVF